MRQIYTTYKIFVCILFVITTLIIIVSCGGDDEKKIVKKSKDIGNIHFYIDNSASMKGYFGNDAEFKTIISDLTTKIDKTIKPIDIWFSSGKDEKYPFDAQRFSSDIATTIIADRNGFQLYEMIKRIADKNDSCDISILVSDCILSFPDSAIKKNREINKQEAPNALKNNIYSTFSDLKRKGFATSIYAFNSKFYDVYYDYQNTRTKKLKGNKRPFYILVFADKEILAKFNANLADITTFKPEKSLLFGLNEEPVMDYEIIPQIERIGKWMKSSKGIKDIEMEKNEPMQFCVSINLENMPEYTKDVVYLQKNLIIGAAGCKVGFEVKEKGKLDKSKLKSEPQIKLYDKATHAIIFKVNEMALSEAKINVSLPLHYDTWYLDWSCMDDKNLSLVEGKTFAFEHFIAGMKEAYETKNKNHIDFSITLNK